MSPEVLGQIRSLGGLQCTHAEVAAFLRVSLRTLQYFFAEHEEAREAFEAGVEAGRISLRRKMWAMADKSAPMAQWLSKQHLGMKEPVQQIETGKPGDFSSLSDEELDKTLAEQAQALAEMDPDFARSVLKGSRTKH